MTTSTSRFQEHRRLGLKYKSFLKSRGFDLNHLPESFQALEKLYARELKKLEKEIKKAQEIQELQHAAHTLLRMRH